MSMTGDKLVEDRSLDLSRVLRAQIFGRVTWILDLPNLRRIAVSNSLIPKYNIFKESEFYISTARTSFS
jgi:hypothetical protein